MTPVKSMAKEGIFLTIFPGIHRGLAYELSLCAVLNCQALLSWGQIPARVTLQGVSCEKGKQEKGKHEGGSQRGFCPCPSRYPSGGIFQNNRAENGNGITERVWSDGSEKHKGLVVKAQPQVGFRALVMSQTRQSHTRRPCNTGKSFSDLFLCFQDLCLSLTLVEHQKEIPDSQTPRITERGRLEGSLELHRVQSLPSGRTT